VRYERYGYLLDRQQIILIVEEPAGNIGDVNLVKSNDYPVAVPIGEAAEELDGVPVGYVLTGFRAEGGLSDQRFEIADALPKGDPEYVSNFEYFEAFWLDGAPLDGVKSPDPADPDSAYYAEDGSTVVTVYAKSFQNLENGAHTIAAEFMIPTADGPYIQMVAAQKFTLDLSDLPDAGDPDAPDNSGDPGAPGPVGPGPNDETQTGTNPVSPTDPGRVGPGPNDGSSPGSNPAGSLNPGDGQPGGETPSGAGQGAPGAGNEAAGGNGPASDGAAADGDATGPDAAASAGVSPGTTAPDAAALTEDAVSGSGATGTPAVTDANAGAPVPAEAVEGLPRDADGLFYFELDGSDRPFEVRIDLPFDEFEDLYFDGALWTRGADYEARAGSTILTVAAERLAALDRGTHAVVARFTEGRTVAFEFALRGGAPAEDADGAASVLAGFGAAFPLAALAVFAAILLLAALLFARGARRRGARTS
jgi:hypothetical protein